MYGQLSLNRPEVVQTNSYLKEGSEKENETL